VGALTVGLIGGDLGWEFVYFGGSRVWYTHLGCFGTKQEEAGECLYGARFVEHFPIRQVVPDGLAQARFCSWAHWARFFIGKNMYCSRYNIFTYNALFYKCLSMREWVDGIGCVWMTLSRLGRCSHLGYNSFTCLRFMAGVPHMHHKLINKYILSPRRGSCLLIRPRASAS